MAEASVRRRRADAQRNREAILRAAREAFATDGIFAPIDAIAMAAGVGNATLYRNFPTRDALLTAVIEDTVREILTASEAYGRDLSSAAALQEWLYQLTWGLRIWHDLPTCIASACEDSTSPVATVTARLIDRTAAFLDKLRRSGAPVAAVSADELFQLATAVSWAVDRFGDDSQRARRRVELATAGVFIGNRDPE